MCEKVVVFDLDDTLCKEIDYLKSAYKEIAHRVSSSQDGEEGVYQTMLNNYFNGKDVFLSLIEDYSISLDKETLLAMYRSHVPTMCLNQGAQDMLDAFSQAGVVMGVITDGRSITQRNKIKALGLEKYILPENIIISEEFGCGKPSEKGYRYFMDRYPGAQFWYVGDNVKKDFVAPNQLGWTTICLKDDGRNIHHQTADVDEGYQPKKVIDGLLQLLSLV